MPSSEHNPSHQQGLLAESVADARDGQSLATSLILLEITQPASEAQFVAGGAVTGTGWVIAEAEVTEVAVFLDEQFLGYASYGESRHDIAKRFPHFVHADASGYSFSVAIPRDVAPNPDARLIVRVATDTGLVARRAIPVAIVELDSLKVVGPSAGSVPSFSSLKLSVDNARIDARGILRVNGWVLSIAQITSLELYLGSTPLGLPELGVERPDVAVNYPDYADARSAGFRLIQDVGDLVTEQAILRVRATTVGGLRRQILMPITLPTRRALTSSQGSSIQFCIDSAALHSDGAVRLAGWAFAEAGLDTINVSLDGVVVGLANSGGDRPDVGNRYPRIPSARRSGFSFSGSLGVPLRGEHVISLEIIDSAGESRSIQIPALVEAAASEGQLAEFLGSGDEIRFDIDSPILNGDRTQESVRGVLTIAGWALSPNGMESVQVFLDEQSLGAAYYGMRREDIAAAFPDVEGALLSGFALTVPHRALGEGERAIRILFTDKMGRVSERTFGVFVEESDETIASTQLRQRLGATEIDLLEAGIDPTRGISFSVLIKPSGSDAESRSKLQLTLSTLLGQAFKTWSAIVIPHSADSVAELTAFLSTHWAAAVASEKLQVLTSPVLPVQHGTVAREILVTALCAGDKLGVDALLKIASTFSSNRELDFVYSDERRIDPSAGSVAAFFKPDWSPELLLSQNYIGRTWVATASLIQASGLDLTSLWDLVDYDIVLRLTEGARKIGHISQILLDSSGVPEEAFSDQQAALERALLRRGEHAEILPGRAPSTWQIKRRPRSTGKVSFIIPTCAARGLIKICIESIREKTNYKNYELIVIDNIPESNAEDRHWVTANSDKVVRIPERFNWSRFNNLGVAQSDGEFLLFLNDDIEILDPTWLDTLIAEAERPNVGVVGPQLLYPDRKVQHAGIFLAGSHGRHAFRFSQADHPGYFGFALTTRNMLAVTGACMMSRRESYDLIGGFDEAHSVVNNDVDYCLRMGRAQQRVVYTPFASLIHHELASRAAISDIYDESRFLGEWGNVLAKGDPYFNRNLSTDSDEYAIETEPSEVVCAGHPLIHSDRVRRILAVKLDHIGDFIIAFPSFQRLKRRFPGAHLTVLASRASKALAAMEPSIDEVIDFDFFHARSGLGRREVSQDEVEELRLRLHAKSFDIAIDLRMQPDTRHILQYTGASLLAGFDNAGSFPWLDVTLEWEGDARFLAKRSHVGDRLAQLVEAVSVACESERSVIAEMSTSAAWDLVRAIPAIEQLPAGFLDRPLVCVHPAVGSDTRQWPEEHFAGLIDLLVVEAGVHVALIGGRDELPIAERVLESIRHRSSVVSLLGALSLRELPLLLRVSALYVGNNSGPKHLAAALGTPTIGIHSGVVDATEWGPFGPRALAIRRKTVCSPCYIAAASDCHRRLACLRKLRPSDVLEASRSMLRFRPTWSSP